MRLSLSSFGGLILCRTCVWNKCMRESEGVSVLPYSHVSSQCWCPLFAYGEFSLPPLSHHTLSRSHSLALSSSGISSFAEHFPHCTEGSPLICTLFLCTTITPPLLYSILMPLHLHPILTHTHIHHLCSATLGATPPDCYFRGSLLTSAEPHSSGASHDCQIFY